MLPPPPPPHQGVDGDTHNRSPRLHGSSRSNRSSSSSSSSSTAATASPGEYASEDDEYGGRGLAATSYKGWEWVVKPVDLKTWPTQNVVKLAYRYYSLRFVAMEIFFGDRTVLMVNCRSTDACRRLHDAVSRRARPPPRRGL